jgi:hypothetical protein
MPCAADRRFDGEHRRRAVAEIAGVLDAADGPGRPLAGADDDDRLVPPGPAAGEPRDEPASDRHEQQAEPQSQDEGHARIERRQLQRKRERRDGEKSKNRHVGGPPEDFDWPEPEAGVESGLRKAEKE